MELRDHHLYPSRFCLSPNHDKRPDSDDVSLIVLHNMSLPPRIYGGHFIEDLFLNRLDAYAHPYFLGIAQLKVSSHLVIDRSGDVTQYVPFNLRAWHAGVSCFAGRARCNDFSIGIELEGSDEDAFTDIQYQILLPILQLLQQHYPKTAQHPIMGHEHIAPGRKSDPGPFFDWNRLQQVGLRCLN